MGTQAVMDMGQPIQHGIEYPKPLTEKYRPAKVADFVGLNDAKKVLTNLLTKQRNAALLFVGPPGTGKTTITMAFANELPGALHHIPAQKCDVSAIDDLSSKLAYCPSKGRFHVVLVDECDQMTDKAQLALLSKLDAAANLKPCFGGGFELGKPPEVIWIFTCNGRGESQTEAPTSLLPRFLGRCGVVAFPKPTAKDIEAFTRAAWMAEGGEESADLAPLSEQCDGVRDALTKAELALITGNLPKRVETKPEVCESQTQEVSESRQSGKSVSAYSRVECRRCGRSVATRYRHRNDVLVHHRCVNGRMS